MGRDEAAHRTSDEVMTAPPAIEPRRIVIAGGGIAALEAVMALHDLGQGRFDLTLVAPDDRFRLRPMTVAVAFSTGQVTDVPLRDVSSRFGVRLVRAAVEAVDADARRVRCSNGDEVGYDVLVLATGARAVTAYDDALTFSDRDLVALARLLDDVEQGLCSSVAVIVPPSGTWSLPAYELALAIARHASDAGVADMPVHLVTPEPTPLAIFGTAGAEATRQLLRDASIQLHTDSFASVERDGRITMMPGGRRITVARVVALPRIEGLAIKGLPADDNGFVPTDDHGRVIGAEHVYAAGDGTNFPVKQGGLATQQADAAARHIAADAGAAVDPVPFRPVMRGMLLTGAKPRFLRSEPAGGRGEPRVTDSALWWPPVKVFGRYLSQWLADEQGIAPSPDGEEHVAIDVELGPDREAAPLALQPLDPDSGQGGDGA